MLIVPTYNESQNIEALVERIRKTAGDEPIFLADDNSPDGTAEAIRRVQRADPHVDIMVRAGKAGYGSARREGFQRILSERLAGYVIQFDADFSVRPRPCRG